MNKAKLKLVEFPIRKRDLDPLSQDQIAAFAVLCFALSELNALQRLSLCASAHIPNDPVLNFAVGTQSNVLFRTISSKLFEVREFLKFQGRYNRTKDKALLDFGRWANACLRDLDSRSGKKFAERMRNEGSFHYHLGPARRRLDSVADDAVRGFFLSETEGGSFFPFGEEVIFIGLVNEYANSKEKQEDARSVIEEWTDWSVAVIKLLNKIFNEFFDRFIQPCCPDTYGEERIYLVDPALVADIGDVMVPIYFRPQKKGE